MSLILGSERVRYDRVIVAAKLNVDDFEITKCIYFIFQILMSLNTV